ncbi:hypothetical protein K7432_010947 [Basidiobolus ranarum]|uniref:Plasmid pRiA4b Orf3-like domain-containing protein n=1 Tax=Basidiobolus ranarum TaxID=34480 RepID=A0ABR2VUR7_9FUNG
MTPLKDKLVIIRASIIQNSDQETWRTVLVPGAFSLLQLHVALQNLFGWKETGCSFHYFAQGQSKESVDVGDNLSFICNYDGNPEIIYQTIYLDECDGWVKPIAPGAYIALEHTHPHDPAPLFAVNHEMALANDEVTTRVLRDERLYQVQHAFSHSSQLFYEFDHGMDLIPTLRLALSYEETIVPTPDEYPIDYQLFPVILDGKGVCSTPFVQQDTFQLPVIQKLLNNAHMEHKEGSIKKCYLCHWFEFDCSKASTQCAQYTADMCCEYCMCNPEFQNIEPYDEVFCLLAWEQGLIGLNSERRRFLEALSNKDTTFKCDWIESDGRSCVFCHNGYFK